MAKSRGRRIAAEEAAAEGSRVPRHRREGEAAAPAGEPSGRGGAVADLARRHPVVASYAYIPALILILFVALSLRMSPVGYRMTDYDSYFMVRMARDVHETGAMPPVDELAYYPVGRSTHDTRILTPQAMATLHRVLEPLNEAISIETASKMYPAVMGGLSVLFFYFFAAELFPGATALLAAFLLATVQGFIYRTSANAPDKEAFAFVLIGVCLWLFAKAIGARERGRWLLWGALSGVVLGLVGYTWGGYRIVYLSISLFYLLQTVRARTDRRHLETFAAVIVGASALLVGSYSAYILRDSPGLFAYGTLAFGALFVAFRERRVVTSPELAVFAAALAAFAVGLVGLAAISRGDPASIVRPVVESFLGVQKQVGDVHRWSVGEQQRSEWAWPFATDWKGGEGGNSWWGNLKLLFPLLFAGILVALAEGHLLDSEPALFVGAFSLMSFLTSFPMVRLIVPLCVPAALAGAYVLSRAWESALAHGSGAGARGRFLHWLSLAVVWLLIPFSLAAFLSSGSPNAQGSPELSETAYVLQRLSSRLGAAAAAGTPQSMADSLSNAFLIAWAFLYLALLASYTQEEARRVLAKRLLVGVFAFVVCAYALVDGYAFSLGLGSSMDEDWLDGLLYLKHDTPEDAVVMTWWDYGYWIQYVANRTAVTDNENRFSNWNVDMGQFFQMTNARDFFSFRKCGGPPMPGVPGGSCTYVVPGTGAGEPFMSYHTDGFKRPSYIIVDNTLIGKFYWVTKIGDNCIRPECGTQYYYLPKAQSTKDKDGRTIDIFMNYLGRRRADGMLEVKVARIDLVRDSALGFVPIVKLGGIDRGQFVVDEEAVIGRYMLAGDPTGTIYETEGLRQGANVLPGMLVIAQDTLLYVEEKTAGMLFTSLYFRNGHGADWVELVHESPNRIVKVFRIKYPEKT